MIPDELYEQGAMLCVSHTRTAPTIEATITELMARDYSFGLKLDGLRCLAFIDNGVVTLRTRTREALNTRYPDLVEHLAALYPDTTRVLDGEIVVFHPVTGKPDFNLGQKRSSQSTPSKIAAVVKTHPASFVAFDLLFTDGDDLRNLPLAARQALLSTESARFGNDPRAQINHWSDNGLAMWAFVEEHELEGLIAKDKRGLYRGRRDAGWVKLKVAFQISVIATSMTKGLGKRANTFGAIVMTLVNEAGECISIGEVGTGFTDRQVLEIQKRMEAGEVLVLEIELAGITKGGKARFPTFRGIRQDVQPLDCTTAQLEGVSVI